MNGQPIDGQLNPGFEDVDLGDGFKNLDLPHNGNSRGGSVTVQGNLRGPGAEKIELREKEDQTGNDQTDITYETVKLNKFLSLRHFIVILVASTGTSSVFISPGPILQYAGSTGLALIIWLLGGILNLSLALCYTELGTMIPDAGGPYAYVVQTFGSLPGFLTMWGYIALIICSTWAVMAHISAVYIAQPFFPDCTAPLVGVRLLAAVFLMTSVALNCVGVRYVSKAQMPLSCTKLIAMLVIIGGGIYRLAAGDTENLKEPFEGTTTEPGQIAFAIFSSYFGYGGWQVIVNMTEESKQPEKDLPRSVYTSFTIVTLAFCLTNMAYFTVLSYNDILGSDAVAVLYIGRLYSPLTALMSVFVAVSTLGSLNAIVMGHSRWLFAAGRVGHMPSFVGMVHQKYLTPWPSLIILGSVTLVMLYVGDVILLTEYISLGTVLVTLNVLAVLLYLRWKRPNDKRPYKVSLPMAVILVLIHVAVLVMAIYQKPRQMGIALAIVVSGFPVYWVTVAWKHKPTGFTKFLNAVNSTVRCTLNLKKVD